MEPSSLTIGDMVSIVFDAGHPQLPGMGQRVYGRVTGVTSVGAFVAPFNRDGFRLLLRKVYCPDEVCLVEEVNGESLF